MTSIREHAFSGCTGLTSITIPDYVTQIDDFAFQKCTGLLSITLPNSLTSIEGSTFDDCTNLAEVTCKAKTPPYVYISSFKNISPDAKLYVPIGSGNAYKNSDWKSSFEQDNIIEKEM